MRPFIDFNDVGLEMLGYSPSDRQEMLRKDVASFYANPEERDAHSQRVAAMGFPKITRLIFGKKTGQLFMPLSRQWPGKIPRGTSSDSKGLFGTSPSASGQKRISAIQRPVFWTSTKMLQTHISPLVLMGSSDGVIKVPRNC